MHVAARSSTQAQMLGGLAVADRLGITREVALSWRSEAWETYGFPAPDGHIGGAPWWWSTTIDSWNAGRHRSAH